MNIQTPDVPKKVLFVDPDNGICVTYAELLRDHFYETRTARNGLECLACLQEFLPDVLVLNREIAWGGGDGVLAWMREEARLQNIAVIVTTSQSPPERPGDFPLPFIVEYLRTPYVFSELLDAVRYATASRSYAWRRPRDYGLTSHYMTHPS